MVIFGIKFHSKNRPTTWPPNKNFTNVHKKHKKLQKLDLLIIGALRYSPHTAHFSVEQAIEAIEMIKPKRAVLTHMGHELDYDILKKNMDEMLVLGTYISKSIISLKLDLRSY